MKNIIDRSEKNILKSSEILITSLGWIYLIGQITQLVLTVILWGLGTFYLGETILSDPSTIYIFVFTTFVAIIWITLSMWWGNYNFKKFAHLNRRTFPQDTTAEEVSFVTKLNVSEILKLQNQKEIILEKTIV